MLAKLSREGILIRKKVSIDASTHDGTMWCFSYELGCGLGQALKPSQSWCYKTAEDETHRRQDMARDFTDTQKGSDRTCPYCNEIIDGKSVNG